MDSEILSMYGLDKANVLLVTLDCCRYDTLSQASTPFIKQAGPVGKARTHGTSLCLPI